MATREEWWEYFNELKEMLKKIQESDLPEDIKEELIDRYLEKLSIVLRVTTRAPSGAHKPTTIWNIQLEGQQTNTCRPSSR